MSSDERVFQALAATGIPGTRGAWPIEERTEPPRFTYELRDGGVMHADNSNFAAFPRYRARLFMREWDETLVRAFEEAVCTIGPCSWGDGYDEEEGLSVAEFDFTCAGGHE